MKKLFLVTSLFVFPIVAFAQVPTLQGFLINLDWFINNVVIFFLYGIAFLMFVINAIRFFVAESNNEKGREKAKNLAIYSIVAMVFISIFWGIIALFDNSIDLSSSPTPVTDYIGPSGP